MADKRIAYRMTMSTRLPGDLTRAPKPYTPPRLQERHEPRFSSMRQRRESRLKPLPQSALLQNGLVPMAEPAATPLPLETID